MPTRVALRHRREELDLSQEQVAHEVGVSTTTYRSWENGSVKLRVGRRRRLAEVMQWSTAQLAYAIDGEIAPNGLAVPQWLNIYVKVEQGATGMWTWQPVTVHALLQTRAYATAVERIGPRPASEDAVTRRVEMRRQRQGVLGRSPDPLQLSVVLDESVLHRVTGSAEVMADQLAHLAEAAQRPNVDVRILPLTAGVHTAAFGAFTLLASDAYTPQLVCVSDRTGVRYLEDEPAVRAHMEVFEHLQDFALSATETIDVINTTAKERYQ